MPTLNRLLTVRQLADFLGVSPSWVYKRTFMDEIPRLYLNDGALRFDPQAIARWIKAQPPRRRKKNAPGGGRPRKGKRDEAGQGFGEVVY